LAGERSKATGAAGCHLVADLPVLRNDKAITIVPLARMAQAAREAGPGRAWLDFLVTAQCPLSGVKRTSRFARVMSAYDSKPDIGD